MKKAVHSKPFLIAHRGESFDAPENTIASINLAWLRNADAVEIDVRLTQDNEIVVMHDSNTKRTSGASLIVKHQPLQKLKMVNVGSYKGEKLINEKIPTLQEVLKTLPQEKYIFIEIKCGIEIINPLKKLLETVSINNAWIKLIGFNPEVMSALKKSFPLYEVYLCKRISREKFIFTVRGWEKIIIAVKENKFNGLNLSYSRCLTRKVVQKIKSSNLKLYVWTINDFRKAERLINYGVDGIMSDKVGWLKSKFI